MTINKTILITGAGSGFAEATAIGMAQAGHTIIATAQISPQVAALREKVADLGLDNVRVERLDLHDPYDVAFAQSFDVDVLWSNAGIGESGPVSEIPIGLVRGNYETNVFKPLELTQGFIKRWVAEGKKAKIVFTSSMGGLFTPAGWGTYVSTKHALESIAEAIAQEVAPFGIKVQTINPGAYLTGYNETMADAAFRWLDDAKNFTKRHQLRATFDALLASPQGHLDPREMIDRMIAIVPADTGKFRNVCPQFVEDMLKDAQAAAWTAEI
jgi:NAD(P)-dependent dehydrogenase (short-subunit alcohol dehydrogenase family)